VFGVTFCLRNSSVEPKNPSRLLPDRGTRSRFESFSAYKRYSGERDRRAKAGQRPGTREAGRAGSRQDSGKGKTAGRAAGRRPAKGQTHGTHGRWGRWKQAIRTREL
jgi:hypothetical protein